jgi:carbamoyl-phosphate synthase large subunit
LETETDAISDGAETLVPAIMEHIELAGIHSGDSACAIPPISIPDKHQETLIKYTKKIAKELKVVGLMNMQYAICKDVVYVLEANPRASRTVPIVSKVCGLSMARIATQLMMGKRLSDLDIKERKPSYYGVKESVFPFNMMPEVDPVLGPEMRSTGEVLGMADSFGMAFYKAEEAAKMILPLEGTVLISVAKKDREDVLEVAKQFAKLGFKIRTTDGTRDYLAGKGVKSDLVLKLNQGRPNIMDAIVNQEIQLVINTPAGKLSQTDDSYIRKAAIKHRLPYITTLTAALAAAKGIEARRKGVPKVRPLQSYHASITK